MSGHDSKYFSTTKKGEIPELKEELNSQYKVNQRTPSPVSPVSVACFPRACGGSVRSGSRSGLGAAIARRSAGFLLVLSRGSEGSDFGGVAWPKNELWFASYAAGLGCLSLLAAADETVNGLNSLIHFVASTGRS